LTVNLDPDTFTLISSIVPQDLALTAANNYPLFDGVQYQSWNATAQNYNPILQYFSEWIDTDFNPVPAPVVTVGQSWFHTTPSGAPTAWTRSFTP
jgi:hypothetical protein